MKHFYKILKRFYGWGHPAFLIKDGGYSGSTTGLVWSGSQ